MSVFLDLPEERVLLRTEHFFVIEDGFPVAPGHLLVISNRPCPDWFSLTPEEQGALPAVLDLAKAWIEERHQPDGYNVGMNCGEAAGQTVMHFHCHLIPRTHGDTPRPRGGVRLQSCGAGDRAFITSCGPPLTQRVRPIWTCNEVAPTLPPALGSDITTR